MSAATQFDPNAWLEEASKSAGLKPESRKLLEQVFAQDEGALKYASQSFLRQSDYSKHLDGLKKKEADLQSGIEAKEAELDSYKSELGTWHQGEAAKVARAEKQLESLKTQFQTVTEKLKAGYTEYGLPLPEGVSLEPQIDREPASVPTQQPREPAMPEGKYVDMDEHRRFANVALRNQFELQDIVAEHQKLYGSLPDNTTELLDRVAAGKGKVSLRDAWEEKYGVPAKREEIRQADENARIEKRAGEIAQQRISESVMPSPRREAHSSSVLQRFQHAPQPADATEKDPMRGVKSAVQSYMEGKYRQQAS